MSNNQIYGRSNLIHRVYQNGSIEGWCGGGLRQGVAAATVGGCCSSSRGLRQQQQGVTTAGKGAGGWMHRGCGAGGCGSR